MPTYEYRCAQGHEFEVFQRISEPPVEKCIHCGSSAERLLSAGAGLLFKGSGFYITDYRSDTYKKAAEAEKSPGTPKTGDAAKADPSAKSAAPKNDKPAKSGPSTTSTAGSD